MCCVPLLLFFQSWLGFHSEFFRCSIEYHHGYFNFFKSNFIYIVCVFLNQDASLFEDKCEWVCTDMSKIHLPSVVLSRVTPK